MIISYEINNPLNKCCISQITIASAYVRDL